MKIAFVGASGYGNIGDDTYPVVFAEQLAGHELCFYNSDLPRSLPDNLDMIVIGGGGVLHNVGAEPEEGESHHFRCMRFYMDAAIERGIPWGFLSCGFQFQAQREASYAKSLKPWVVYLQQAFFITLRSHECVRIACEISRRSDVHFFPDAAYLFHPAGEREQPQPGGVTIVPAGQVNLRDVRTNHHLRQFAASEVPMTWLSMGAKVDDGRMMEEAALRFPESRVIPCSDPAMAFRCIAASRLVITGRYHGMIFSRINRVPFITPIDVPYKLRHEDYTAPISTAAGHFEVLRRFIRG